MATIVKGGTAPSNTGNRWTEEEVRIYEETCEGYKGVCSSQRAWLRFLGAEY